MDQIVLFALLGLGTGALIAGIGLGVVLTYRGSGVINVATGAEAMAAGYAFYSLRTVTGTLPALLGTLAFTVLLGVAIELLAFRPLRTASPLARLVASLGVLLTLQATVLLWFGTAAKQIPSTLPTWNFQLSGIQIPINRFWMMGIVLVLVAAVAALFRFTRFGLATKAASENEVNAMLAGISPNQLSLAHTILASGLAGIM